MPRMRLPLKTTVKANTYELTIENNSPISPTDPTTNSITDGLLSFSTQKVTIHGATSQVFFKPYLFEDGSIACTKNSDTYSFQFSETMFFSNNSVRQVPSGWSACAGLFYFKCDDGKYSEPFYYLSDTLELDPPPDIINGVRIYKPPFETLNINNSNGNLYFTDYPTTGSKYILISNAQLSFDDTLTNPLGNTIPSGLYFFENDYGKTSLPFLYQPSTIYWQPNYSFPVGGIAVSGGEADKNNILYLEQTLTAYKDSSWSKNNSNLVRLPIVWGYGSKSNYTGDDSVTPGYNEKVLFTNVDFTTSTSEWGYNQAYYDNLVSFVSYCVTNGKVVIIDMHTYGIWHKVDILTDTGANLALIWGQTLRLFKKNGDDTLFQNPLVWFELVNEPYSVTDFIYYQKTIDQIRSSYTYPGMNSSYSNKIVMGLSAGQHGGHIVINSSKYKDKNGNIIENSQYYNGLSDYNGSIPSGNNLCITIHQYFNKNGSGNYLDSGQYFYTMIPNWWNFQTYGLSTTIDQELSNIVNNPKLSTFDFILGEFGYDKNYDQSIGSNAVTYLLDAMVNCNTTKGFDPINSSTIDYLNNTTGGLWLGFAVWQIDSDSYSENNAESLTSIYTKYFS